MYNLAKNMKLLLSFKPNNVNGIIQEHTMKLVALLKIVKKNY
jgi:hypothetical protein